MKREVILIAHRGKGPTSKFTAPTEELWLKCKDKGLLIDQKIVPQKILESFNIRLPEHTPPENTIAAFRQGLEEGADAIELDIFLSKDGVPMVIHDDELNRNVSGARRSAKLPQDDGYLGNVHDFNALELKSFDMGNRNKIPALVEVIDFLTLFNKIRASNKKSPVILNIEFKDKTDDNVTSTLQVVGGAIEKGKILKDNVIYCSFDHDSLFQAIKIDPQAQIALALKTAFLFGEGNVNIQRGWTVELGTKYQESAMSNLESKIIKAQQEGSRITALDAVLWDIEPELVDLAKRYNIDLHASTSDFRDFTNIVFIGNLVKICQSVKVFFKTDEPKKISMILQRAYKESELDLSESKIVNITKILEPASSLEPSSELDLTDVTVSEVKNFSFLRQPKPRQETTENYHDESLEKLADQKKLSQYIKERYEKSVQIISLIEQIQEEPIEIDLLSIFDELSPPELIQYWDLSDIIQ